MNFVTKNPGSTRAGGWIPDMSSAVIRCVLLNISIHCAHSGYLFYSNKELSQFLYDRLLPLNPELRCYTHLFGLEDDKK